MRTSAGSRVAFIFLLATSALGSVACTRAQKDESAGAAPSASSARHRKPHRDPPAAHGGAHPDIALPDVASHPPSQNLGGGVTAEHPCGTAHVGDSEQALECFDAESTQIGEAAKPVIAHAVLSGGAAQALPNRVDHRLDGFEGPVRNQGKTPACTGFSLAATMDEATANALGHPGDVSVLHLWSRYAVTKMGEAVKQNRNHALAEEPTWPFAADAANAFQHAVDCKSGKLTGDACKTEPDRASQKNADEHPYVTLLGVTQVDSGSTEALSRKLAGGQDIWFCAKTGGHLSCGKKGCNLEKMAGSDDVYIRDFDAKSQPGGHCMSLAGYQKTPSGTYFLIHNSWGDKWGNKGYAFMHEKTFEKNVEKGATFVVQVHPSSMSTSGLAASQIASKGCDANMLRDSHTGLCEEPCPDGGARHDNTCGQTASCPAGQVNVTGSCVTAAPTSHGNDSASGVSFLCTPGACSYTLPKGKLGCTEEHCSVTCPAPKFELAAGENGSFCTP